MIQLMYCCHGHTNFSYGFVTFDTAEEASKVQEQVILHVNTFPWVLSDVPVITVSLYVRADIKILLKEFKLQTIM